MHWREPEFVGSTWGRFDCIFKTTVIPIVFGRKSCQKLSFCVDRFMILTLSMQDLV